MTNIRRTREAIQQVLVTIAEQCSRTSGFTVRTSKLTAALFVQSLVLSWMQNRHASQSMLAATVGLSNVGITPQAINSRLGTAGLSLLKSVFGHMVGYMIGGQDTGIELLKRFRSVRLMDSTTITLPAELSEIYPGCGDRHGSTAAVKLHVGMDLVNGKITGPELTPARLHDGRSSIVDEGREEGSLVLRDLGYFSLSSLEDLSKRGIYWVTRLKNGTQIYDANGAVILLEELLKRDHELNIPVTIGHSGVCGRLTTQRLPKAVAEKRRRMLRRSAAKHGSTPRKASLLLCGYVIAITNIPETLATRAEVLELLRARWQVELLFKHWKSNHALDEWRSRRPDAILCELYAKLIGILLEHWILLLGAWNYADRSIVNASKMISHGAILLMASIKNSRRLDEALKMLVRLQSNGCRLQKRRKHPSTFQRLNALSQPLA